MGRVLSKRAYVNISLLLALSLSAVAFGEKREYKILSLQGRKIKVEVSETPKARAQGLMHRKSLDKNTGMLFVFPRPQRLSFWMKNTHIPLSIAFFDQDQRMLEVMDMKVESILRKDVRNYVSSSPAQYALEMNQGWFKKNKIKKGSRFRWHSK